MSHCPTRATLHKLPGRSVLSWPGPASQVVVSLVFINHHSCRIPLQCTAGHTDSRRNHFQSLNQLIDELTAPALRAESTIYEHPISLDCEPERSAACYTPPFPTNSMLDTAYLYPKVVCLGRTCSFWRWRCSDSISNAFYISVDCLFITANCTWANDMVMPKNWIIGCPSINTEGLDATCGRQLVSM